MACSNCNKPSCGCSGTYVVSKTCPPACSEVFNASCIVYTGVDLTCTDAISGLTSTVISRNDYLDTALTAIVNYICARFNPANLPSSVVVSGDDFVVVSASTVGYVTTYTVTLDPAGLPSASIVTAGDNVVVTGDGSAGDPYVINADESIVAVEAGSPLTLVVDPATPGPYETLYTLGIDTDLLPDTFLETSQGHITIVETQNVPTAGDTTYTLDVDEVTVTAVDNRLTSTLTSPGGAPAFERTFDIAISDTEMANWIMDTVIFSSPSFPDGLIAGTGISLNWNPATFQLEIENTFNDPERWFELIDFTGFNVTPTAGNASLSIIANPATVDLGGDGIDAVLSGTGTAAVFTLTNTDPGSSQLIFGGVTCSNTSGTPGGTCSATNNTDSFNIVGGAEIDVTVPAPNTIQITNTITAVYSNFIGDNPLSLQAGSTTDTLEILGGESITTVGNNAGPGNNTLTIDFDGVTTIGAGLSGSGTSIDPLVNAAPDQTVVLNSGTGITVTGTYPNFTVTNADPGTDVTLNDAGTATHESLVNDGTGPVLATKGLQAGKGMTLSSTATDISIVADVAKYGTSALVMPTDVGAPPPTLTINHNLGTFNNQVTVILQSGAYLTQGTDYSLAIIDADNVALTNLNAANTGAALYVSVIG